MNPCFPLRRANPLLLCRVSTIFFEHFLESIAIILSVMCLSQGTVNCGITLILASFDIFTSSLLLNFRGAWAFMFCCTNSGKRDTTLSYLIMIITTCWCLQISYYELLVRWYFPLGNMIAKFYYLYIICYTIVKDLIIAFTIKNYFIIIYLLEDEQELSLGMLIRP